MPLDGKNYTDTLTDTEKAARDDLFLWLDRFPARVPALLDAVRDGRMFGATVIGDCRCVIGTLAGEFNDESFHRNVSMAFSVRPRDADGYPAHAPIELFVWSILPGDTPTSSPTVARLEEWIMQWQAA